jgi:hypothetical protein
MGLSSSTSSGKSIIDIHISYFIQLIDMHLLEQRNGNTDTGQLSPMSLHHHHHMCGTTTATNTDELMMTRKRREWLIANGTGVCGDICLVDCGTGKVSIVREHARPCMCAARRHQILTHRERENNRSGEDSDERISGRAVYRIPIIIIDACVPHMRRIGLLVDGCGRSRPMIFEGKPDPTLIDGAPEGGGGWTVVVVVSLGHSLD